MSEKNHELIDELYDKLTWYTFQASADEFNYEEVNSILHLLEELDPLTINTIHHTPTSHNVPFYKMLNWPEIIIKSVKIAACIFSSMFVINALSLNTTAYKDKSFFEIIHDGPNSMKITVTGNEGNDAYITRYDSWWVLKGYYPDLMIPTYLPDDVSLDQLSERDHGSYTDFVGVYTKNLTITIRSFRENYAGDLFYEGWELFDIVDGIEYYQKDDNYKLSFPIGRRLYNVEWNDLDEIRKIIKSFS